MERCLRVKGPRRLPHYGRREEGMGLAASQTTLGYVPFLITAFLTEPPVVSLLAATQGGLVNLHS